MLEKDFTDASEGTLHPTYSAITDITHGFVPAPLPPGWEWPVEFWPLLMKARESLAKLDGIGHHLRSPELVLRPLQHREAQKSSRLEGTITDPQQQALFEVDPDIAAHYLRGEFTIPVGGLLFAPKGG